MRLAIIPVAVCLFLLSCKEKKNDYRQITNDPFLYCKTVKELNNVVMQNNFPPIVASRNYVYANIAAYEVIAAGDPQHYQSLAGQLSGLDAVPAAPNGKEIDFHFASLLAFCQLGEAVTFPEGSMQEYVDSLKQLVRDHGMPGRVLDNSVDYAAAVGKVILVWSRKDNYAQTRTDPKYTVIDTPGRWVPTPPAYAQALEPHWRKIRPMVMDSANQFIPPRPPLFNITDPSGKYYQEVLAVKNAGDSLTDEQKHIAEFWDDLGNKVNVSGHVMFVTKKFSPPGHWMNIVGIAAKNRELILRPRYMPMPKQRSPCLMHLSSAGMKNTEVIMHDPKP